MIDGFRRAPRAIENNEDDLSSMTSSGGLPQALHLSFPSIMLKYRWFGHLASIIYFLPGGLRTC